MVCFKRQIKAEAEKYRLEKIAEADKQRVILEAEAEAEAIRMQVIAYNQVLGRKLIESK